MATSDSDEEESLVVIGTAFEVPDQDEPRRKKIQVEDLPVTDSRGRSRFHGAFTGGFSAGYFNTAGSKEGWTPSTFTSSRSQRAESSKQRPEYFMDDEDLGEHGIAPRSFTTTDSFVSTSRKRVIGASDPSSIIPGDMLFADLVVPDVTPIGVRLLRRMGWRDGQGIGPRQKKKLKQKDCGRKVYGCSLPPTGSDSELSEGEADFIKDFTFAPKDTTPVDFTPKDNYHGIGYSGLNPQAALYSGHLNLFETEARVTKKGKRGIRGQAFGVGALEDDDDDIYSVDHLSNYHKTLGGDDENDRFGWTAPKGRQLAIEGQSVSNISRTLEGFQLSSKQLVQSKVFPPPHIPPNYRPFHIERSKLSAVTTQSPVPDRKSLNSLSRGLLLGELPLMAPLSKITPATDSLKPQQTTSGKVSRFSGQSNNVPVESGNVPVLPPTISDAGKTLGTSNQYKPFSKDPAKQTRYDQYLSLSKLGIKDPYDKLAAGELTEWEREREKEEFARSAHLYKPLSAMMASRFTTAKYHDDVDQASAPAQEEVEKSDAVKAAEMKMFGKLTREILEWHPDKILCKRFNVPDPYPDSQIVGLPGSKRDKFSVFSFLNFPAESESPAPAPAPAPESTSAPSQPLSIEFNKVPKKRGQEASGQKTKKVTTANIFAAYFEEEDKKLQSQKSELKNPSTGDYVFKAVKDAESVNTGTAESENKKLEELAKPAGDERPPMDLFKAIFQDSDSENSSDEEEGKDTEEQMEVTENYPQSSLISDKSVVNQGEVHQSAAIPETPFPGNVRIQSLEDRLSPNVEVTVADNDDMFGPSLPPQPLTSYGNNSGSGERSQTSEGDWSGKKTSESQRKQKHKDKDRDRTSHKHNKHKKKKSKHKKKHKKGKKKSCKRRNSANSGYEASTSDSGEESSDRELPTDREILNRLKLLDGKERLKASDFM